MKQFIKILILLTVNLTFLTPLFSENNAKQITFGYTSGENPAVIYEKFIPLLQLISEKLQVEINYLQTYTYMETQEAFLDGSIDIGILNTLSFIKLSKYESLLPLVSRVKEGFTTYQSYLIVRKDSPLWSYEDLKKTTVVFGDPFSTSSSFIPKLLLEENNVSVSDDFKEILIFPKHDSILYSVLNRTADIGAIASFIFDEFESNVTKNLRIFAKSEPFPLGPFVVQKNLGEEFINSLRSVLLDLQTTAEGLSVLEKAELESFIPYNEEDYKQIKTLYFENMKD